MLIDERDKLIQQLDQDQPYWYIDWAVQTDLKDYIDDLRHIPQNKAVADLKRRIADRLFHRILKAAISCELVSVKTGVVI